MAPNGAEELGEHSVQLATGEIFTLEASQQNLMRLDKAMTIEYNSRILLWPLKKGSMDWPWKVRCVVISGPQGDMKYGHIAPVEKADKRKPKYEVWEEVVQGMALYDEKLKKASKGPLGVGCRNKKAGDQSGGGAASAGDGGGEASKASGSSSSGSSSKDVVVDGDGEDIMDEDEDEKEEEDEEEDEEEAGTGKGKKRKVIRTEQQEKEEEQEEGEEAGAKGSTEADGMDVDSEEAADEGGEGDKAKKQKVDVDAEALRAAAKKAKGVTKKKGNAKKVDGIYAVVSWLREELSLTVDEADQLVEFYGAVQVGEVINGGKLSKRAFNIYMQNEKFDKKKKGMSAQAAKLILLKWCTPLKYLKSEGGGGVAVGGGGAASSAGGDVGPSVVPVSGQDTGKLPVEYMATYDQLSKKVGQVNFTPFYRMRYFVAPESVPPKGKTGAPAEFMFFLASVCDLQVLKPMEDGEERDFAHKFELMEAIALGQMSKARAKYITKGSLSNHDPASTRINELTDKERTAIRSSPEYKSIQRGFGNHYTTFWANHDDNHHLHHLDRMSREIVGTEWNKRMGDATTKAQVQTWADALAEDPAMADDNPMFKNVIDGAYEKISDLLVRDFFFQEMKQLKKWGVITSVDAGVYDADGKLEERADHAWPELIDYLIVKAAGSETEFNRLTTRPCKRAVSVLLCTLCKETLWSLLRDVKAEQPTIGLNNWDWDSKTVQYPKIPGETHSTRGAIQRAAWNALSTWWADSPLTPAPLPRFATKADVVQRIKHCFPRANEREIAPKPSAN